MTDRELLELAAMAAGVKSARWSKGFGGLMGTQDGQPIIFNPLTDDGTAFRLAVRLGFEVGEGVGAKCQKIALVIYHDASTDRRRSVQEDYNDEPYAATRRTIVRAAAAIGAQMEQS